MAVQRHHKHLLILDGIVNLLLGLLLLLFPLGMAELLGVPDPGLNLYPSLLGAVLFGIGVALLLEAYAGKKGIRGLGLEGAIAINLCGAGVLVIWLLVSPFEIPARGYIILWTIALLVLAIGFVELFYKMLNPTGRK